MNRRVILPFSREWFELQETNQDGTPKLFVPMRRFESYRDVRTWMMQRGTSRSHADFVIAVTYKNPGVPYDLVESDDSPQGEVIKWTATLTLRRLHAN